MEKKKENEKNNKNCNEFAMSANWGRISAGHPDPILDPLEVHIMYNTQ